MAMPESLKARLAEYAKKKRGILLKDIEPEALPVLADLAEERGELAGIGAECCWREFCWECKDKVKALQHKVALGQMRRGKHPRRKVWFQPCPRRGVYLRYATAQQVEALRSRLPNWEASISFWNSEANGYGSRSVWVFLRSDILAIMEVAGITKPGTYIRNV